MFTYSDEGFYGYRDNNNDTFFGVCYISDEQSTTLIERFYISFDEYPEPNGFKALKEKIEHQYYKNDIFDFEIDFPLPENSKELALLYKAIQDIRKLANKLQISILVTSGVAEIVEF